MKFQLPWKKQKIVLEHDLQTLENRLSSLLNYVEPRIEFVRGLRTKLIGKPKRRRVRISSEKIQKGVLIVSGVFSLTLIVITGVRVLITILGAIGIIQIKKQVEESAPVQPPRMAA